MSVSKTNILTFLLIDLFLIILIAFRPVLPENETSKTNYSNWNTSNKEQSYSNRTMYNRDKYSAKIVADSVSGK